MEKKNVLRVGGGGQATLRASVKTIEASPNGGTIDEFYIQSYREKLVNGKRTGEISAVNDVGSPDLLARDWLHYNYTRLITVDNIPVLDVSIRADKNTGSSSRSYNLDFTQNPSGKKVTVTVNQAPARTIISTKYFCVGNPDNGNYIYDAETETYETHVDSTISRMIFEVFKSDIYSDGTIETNGMGTIDTFEISQQGPVSGGFSIAPDQTQGTDSMVVSTKGGSPGTYFGWFEIRFSYGNIIASNRIDLYQY